VKFHLLGILAAVVASHGAWISGASAADDALFSHMMGHWSGKGSRTFLASGKTIHVISDTRATVSIVNGQERLTSVNQITEVQPGSLPHTYETTYWITSDPNRAGSYLLGSGTSEQPSSTGALSGDLVFRTAQNLGGGEPPYIIQSTTEFQKDGSTLYTELLTRGQNVLTRSSIQYTPIP
jgi:hypothetical protein